MKKNNFTRILKNNNDIKSGGAATPDGSIDNPNSYDSFNQFSLEDYNNNYIKSHSASISLFTNDMLHNIGNITDEILQELLINIPNTNALTRPTINLTFFLKSYDSTILLIEDIIIQLLQFSNSLKFLSEYIHNIPDDNHKKKLESIKIVLETHPLSLEQLKKSLKNITDPQISHLNTYLWEKIQTHIQATTIFDKKFEINSNKQKILKKDSNNKYSFLFKEKNDPESINQYIRRGTYTSPEFNDLFGTTPISTLNITLINNELPEYEVGLFTTSLNISSSIKFSPNNTKEDYVNNLIDTIFDKYLLLLNPSSHFDEIKSDFFNLYKLFIDKIADFSLKKILLLFKEFFEKENFKQFNHNSLDRLFNGTTFTVVPKDDNTKVVFEYPTAIYDSHFNMINQEWNIFEDYQKQYTDNTYVDYINQNKQFKNLILYLIDKFNNDQNMLITKLNEFNEYDKKTIDQFFKLIKEIDNLTSNYEKIEELMNLFQFNILQRSLKKKKFIDIFNEVLSIYNKQIIKIRDKFKSFYFVFGINDSNNVTVSYAYGDMIKYLNECWKEINILIDILKIDFKNIIKEELLYYKDVTINNISSIIIYPILDTSLLTGFIQHLRKEPIIANWDSTKLKDALIYINKVYREPLSDESITSLLRDLKKKYLKYKKKYLILKNI